MHTVSEIAKKMLLQNKKLNNELFQKAVGWGGCEPDVDAIAL